MNEHYFMSSILLYNLKNVLTFKCLKFQSLNAKVVVFFHFFSSSTEWGQAFLSISVFTKLPPIGLTLQLLPPYVVYFVC